MPEHATGKVARLQLGTLAERGSKVEVRAWVLRQPEGREGHRGVKLDREESRVLWMRTREHIHRRYSKRKTVNGARNTIEVVDERYGTTFTVP